MAIKNLSAIITLTLFLASSAVAQTVTSVQYAGFRQSASGLKAPLYGGPDSVIATNVTTCRSSYSVDNRNRMMFHDTPGVPDSCRINIVDNVRNVSTTTNIPGLDCVTRKFFMTAADIGGVFAYAHAAAASNPTYYYVASQIYHTQDSGANWTAYALPNDTEPGYTTNLGVFQYQNTNNNTYEFRNKQIVADPNGNINVLYFTRKTLTAPLSGFRYKLNLFRISPTGQTSNYFLAYSDNAASELPYIRAEGTDSHLAIVFGPGRRYQDSFLQYTYPFNSPAYITIPWSATNPSQSMVMELLGQDLFWGNPLVPDQIIPALPMDITTDGGVLYLLYRSGDTGYPFGWIHKVRVIKVALDANGRMIAPRAQYPAPGSDMIHLPGIQGVEITNHLLLDFFFYPNGWENSVLDFTATRRYPASYGTGGASVHINTPAPAPDLINSWDFNVVKTNAAMTSSFLQRKNDITQADLPAGTVQEAYQRYWYSNNFTGVRGGIMSTFLRSTVSYNPYQVSFYCTSDFSQ